MEQIQGKPILVQVSASFALPRVRVSWESTVLFWEETQVRERGLTWPNNCQHSKFLNHLYESYHIIFTTKVILSLVCLMSVPGNIPLNIIMLVKITKFIQQ